MTILGLDISHWSELAHTPVDVKAQGYDFLFWKATEGSTYKDATFEDSNPAYGDVLHAAYHYLDESDPFLQCKNILSVVPVYLPIIIDMEKAGTTLETCRQLIALLHDNAYTTPLLYLPHWYWVQIGQPDISAFPLLWASHYVTGSDYGSTLFQNVNAGMWTGYGGNHVGMLQFTSHAKLDGVSGDYDVSAFPETRETLALLLGYSKPAPPPAPPTVQRYVVRAGDTLWSIALATLEDGARWHEIATANNMSNPNRVVPGQSLVIPGWNGVLRSIHEAVRYTVVSGDSLTSIAKRFNTSVEIVYDANRATIGRDPNRIGVGMVLSIPTIR